MNGFPVGALLVCATFVAGPLGAQDLTAYRSVHLGDSVEDVLASTGAAVHDVRLRNQRPALIQELDSPLGGLGTPTAMMLDPVRRVRFSFYNDQLYRIAVSYDRLRIDGLTDADLIESLSTAYGTALTSPAAKLLRHSESPEVSDRQQGVVARWEDSDHSIVLIRGGYLEPLTLVMLAKQVANDARRAGTEATRLDLEERPEREAAKARQDAEDARLAQEKARPANKAAFKP